MKRYCLFIAVVPLLLLQIGASAQYKLVLNTVEFPVNLDWVYSQLPEEQEFESQMDELGFIADFSL